MKNAREKEENKDFYQTTRFDLIFIVLILFFSVVSFWVIHKRFQPSSGQSAVYIYQKDKLLEDSGLDKDKIIAILDGRMQFELKDGRVRVISTDCPHHICKNMGWIKYNGETIVCVPNQVLIEIKSEGPAIIDAVAY
ncbi:MAG: NusG domain II-containing protein [Candidatus Omnitrophota bacterium]|nr:NusG domain II-containing protein [Candidatus Omnitrophota bacterium]